MTLRLETIVQSAARKASSVRRHESDARQQAYSARPHTYATDNKSQLKTIRRVKADVGQKMTYLLNSLAVNIIDALFEEMSGTDDRDLMNKHFNIKRALKTRYAQCIEQYEFLIDLSWVHLIKKKDKQSAPDPGAYIAGLLKAHSKQSIFRHKKLLEELRLRFSLLADRDLQHHPLSPANLYLCFWHSTKALGLNTEERKLLLPLFARFVMNQFGQVLTTANKSLIKQGIG